MLYGLHTIIYLITDLNRRLLQKIRLVHDGTYLQIIVFPHLYLSLLLYVVLYDLLIMGLARPTVHRMWAVNNVFALQFLFFSQLHGNHLSL
jgi:hypothetical protein